MAGVIADTGLAQLLKYLSSGAVNNWINCKLRLFKNNVTPDNTTVLGGLTEATFTGYAAITLAQADFGAPGVAGHVASVIVAIKTFTITAGTQDIYGWHITDSTGTILLASQRDPAAPITLDSAAVNSLSLILTIQMKDIATP